MMKMSPLILIGQYCTGSSGPFGGLESQSMKVSHGFR